MKERNKPTKSFIERSIEEIEKEAFKEGYEAGFAKACHENIEFISLVKSMRDAQKEFEDCPMENEADIQRLGKKAEVIEQAVDNWLEKNM